MRQRGLAPDWVHADQSAGLIHGPTVGTNAVRPGLALYGADPTLEGGHGLEAVMTVRARVLATKRVPAGARDRFFEEHCDTTHAADFAAHVERVRSKYGRVDALVSLVGGFAGGTNQTQPGSPIAAVAQ